MHRAVLGASRIGEVFEAHADKNGERNIELNGFKTATVRIIAFLNICPLGFVHDQIYMVRLVRGALAEAKTIVRQGNSSKPISEINDSVNTRWKRFLKEVVVFAAYIIP